MARRLFPKLFVGVTCPMIDSVHQPFFFFTMILFYLLDGDIFYLDIISQISFNRASIKPGTWNIPEHSGTFRNIPEHGKIKIFFNEKIIN